MIKSLRGITTDEIPFIQNEILDFLNSADFQLIDCDEIIEIERDYFIFWLETHGNQKMLKRVRSTKHKFYLLLLNHSLMTLKMVSIPFSDLGKQIDLSA